MTISYIGADVHPFNTELCIRKGSEIIGHFSVPTTIPAIREVLQTIPNPKSMTIEEGSMAGWLYRNLRHDVDPLVICDPRRNKSLYADGDVDDKISAAKLAELLQGGFLRPIYHTDDEQRVELKQWVALYNDHVQAAVRLVNQIRALCRTEGLSLPGRVLRDPTRRQDWLHRQNKPALARQLKVLWIGLDATAKQVKASKQELVRLTRGQPIVAHWQEVTGMGPVRAATFLAYVDTPWRFRTMNKLRRYCGIGIHHVTSGKDRHGNPKPARLAMDRRCNHRLKNVILGAATSAIWSSQANVFKTHYERMIDAGIDKSNARHTVARQILGVLWGMWKTGRRFDPHLTEPLKARA
jgi:transposase